MDRIKTSSLVYTPKPVDEVLLQAVERNADPSLHQEWDEYILHSRVICVRWLDPANAAALFSEYVEPEGNISPDEILRIDWEAWVVPQKFTGKFEQAVEHRVESICADLKTILLGQIYTYPDHNHIWWQDDPDDVTGSDALPREALAALLELAQNEWWDYITEYAEDPAFLESLTPVIRGLIENRMACQSD